MRGISFLFEKMKIMKFRYELLLFIKLISYVIKRNRYIDEDEVYINKRIKIIDLVVIEFDFDIK